MTLSQLLHHGPVAVAFLLAAAVALAVVVVLAIKSQPMALREDEFLAQVNKLLGAENAERAAKLCAAGGARPVAQLVGVGVDALLRSNLRPADGIERAKGEMAKRLPAMQGALMPGIIAAAAVAALSTLLGLLVLAQFGKEPPVGLVLGFLGPVEVLAAIAIAARVRIRADLARALADFGSFER